MTINKDWWKKLSILWVYVIDDNQHIITLKFTVISLKGPEFSRIFCIVYIIYEETNNITFGITFGITNVTYSCCFRCGNANFARRDKCNRCGSGKWCISLSVEKC